MNNKLRIALVFGMNVVATSTLFAQKGCIHSPEAPTGVLMMVGSVGMFYGSSVISKMLRRRGGNQ